MAILLSTGAQRVLDALRSNAEGCIETRPDGSHWQDCILSNAQFDVEPQISRHTFAGHLNALTEAGLYHPLDGVFGSVRLEDAA